MTLHNCKVRFFRVLAPYIPYKQDYREIIFFIGHCGQTAIILFNEENNNNRSRLVTAQATTRGEKKMWSHKSALIRAIVQRGDSKETCAQT